jgi:hypothetical protein
LTRREIDATCRWHLLRLSAPFLLTLLIATIVPILHARIKGNTYVDTSLNRYRWTLLPPIASALLFVLCMVFLWTLPPAQRELMFWRGLSPLSGVSPSAPVVALAIGGYLWCCSKRRSTRLLLRDRPRLPSNEHLGSDSALQVFSGKQYDCLESTAAVGPWKQWALVYFWVAVGLFTVALYVQPWGSLRTLEPHLFSRTYELLFLYGATVVLGDAILVLIAWKRLKSLLTMLSALPLRRTLMALQDFPWKSLWSLGNTKSCRIFFLGRIRDASSHLVASLPTDRTSSKMDIAAVRGYCESIQSLTDQVSIAAGGDLLTRDSNETQNRSEQLQIACAATAGLLLKNLLVPAWKEETVSLICDEGSTDDRQKVQSSLPLADRAYVRNAEEVVCLVYLAFIQNVLGRLRTLVAGTLSVFLSMVVAALLLAFDPHPAISAALLLLFLAFATTIMFVFWQMHRDDTLSYVTNTTPGEVGVEFWVHAIAFTTGPALALIAIAFPQLANWLFSVFQPGNS